MAGWLQAAHNGAAMEHGLAAAAAVAAARNQAGTAAAAACIPAETGRRQSHVLLACAAGMARVCRGPAAGAAPWQPAPAAQPPIGGGQRERVADVLGVCVLPTGVTAGSSRRRWPDAPRLPHLMWQMIRKLRLPTTKQARSCCAGAPPRQANTLAAPSRRGQTGRSRRGRRSPACGRVSGRERDGME